MDTKEVRIECPCCSSRLEVDVRTGTVVRWREKEEAGEAGKSRGERDWGAAAARVQGRQGTAADKFDESLSREKGRAKDLDDLFRKANEALRRKDEE